MTASPDDRTEANRQVITDAFDAWRTGTAPITDVFAPDMTWRIEGHSRAAKEYKNRQEFVDEVLAPFATRFPPETLFRPVTIRAVHADGDAVVVLWDGRGIPHDGQAYENSYAWFMTLRDGQVVDGTAFFDSISFDAFWTRTEPQG